MGRQVLDLLVMRRTAVGASVRAIVCGGRDFGDREWLFSALDEIGPTGVVHGAARGADSLAQAWARERGVPEVGYPADWRREGRAAGPRRNATMLKVEQPDAVIAFPGGRGTADMIRRAVEAGVPVYDLSSAGWRG